jgi:hypothetical protein
MVPKKKEPSGSMLIITVAAFLTTYDAFTGVITVLVSSPKET